MKIHESDSSHCIDLILLASAKHWFSNSESACSLQYKMIDTHYSAIPCLLREEKCITDENWKN